MESRFLHSPDPSIRRLSAVVYAVATGVAALSWAAWGGFDEPSARYMNVAWLAFMSLAVWFIVAGIGLRVVRRRDRRAASTHSAG